MRKFLLYAAFFLLSVSILILEIVSTRYSKLLFPRFFDFLTISFALFGIGLGGLFAYFLTKKIKKDNLPARVVTISMGYVCSVALTYIFPPVVQTLGNFTQVLFFISLLVSYILWGIIFSLLCKLNLSSISLFYGVGLLGSGAGALATIVFLDAFGSSSVIYLLILIALSGTLLLALFFDRKFIFKFSAGLFILIFLSFIYKPDFFYITCSNRNQILGNWPYPNFQDSNSFSQLDIYTRVLLPMKQTVYGVINYGCFASTMFAYTNMNEFQNGKEIAHDSLTFPFSIKKQPVVAIIGSGAGIDVSRALAAGVTKVDAFELNPLIINWVNKLDSPSVYADKRVTLHIGEGRNSLAQKDQLYDLIYLPSSIPFGNMGAAPHTLIPNYLYTAEAIDGYYSKLKEGGVLAFADDQIFIEKYGQTVLQRFKKRDNKETTNVVFLKNNDPSRPTIILLVKKGGFSVSDIDRIKKNSSDYNIKFITYTPPKYLMTDDRPFFWRIDEVLGHNDVRNIRTISPLQQAFYAQINRTKNVYFYALAIVLIMIIGPFSLILLEPRTSTSPAITSLILYFFAIGIGYITLQLYLVERIAFILGSPLYALSVVLFFFLVLGGLGSLVSSTIQNPSFKSLAKMLFVFITTIFVSISLGSQLVESYTHLSFTSKLLASSLFLTLPAFFSGMIFPLSLRSIQRSQSDLVPWFIGIDGIATVIGSFLFIMLAVTFGFSNSFFVGISAYIFALLITVYLKAHKR